MNDTITLDDIARDLGLSKATVSYVLSGRGPERRIAARTIERVSAHAAAVGYTANAVARNLSRRRTGMAGVVASGFQMDWLHRIYGGLEPVLDEARVTPLFAVRGWSPERELLELRRLAEHRVDGILLLNPLAENRDEYLRHAANRPLILVSDRLESTDKVSSVTWDARPAIRAVVHHLASIGRLRFAFAGVRHAAIGTRHRHEAFLEAVQEVGGEHRDEWAHWNPVSVPAQEPPEIDEAQWCSATPWGRPGGPNALVCLNDNIAFRIVPILLMNSIPVPEAVAVTGLGDLPPYAADFPGITTVVEPLKEIGAESARLLLQLIAAPDDGPRHLAIQSSQVIVRRSTVASAPPAWA